MKSESEAANVWLGIGVNLMLHLCVYCVYIIVHIVGPRVKQSVIDG